MALTVVVTGANRGIGLSFCKFYKAQGYNVIGVCRNSSTELDGIAQTVITGVDVSHAADRQKLFDQLCDVKIDLLINNAGILRNEILGQLDLETIEQQFQVNAVAPLAISEGLLDSLNRSAKIAIITSRMGSIADNGSGGRYGYRMSKAALNAAAKSLALDVQSRGITVGIYHPGLVGTEMIGGAGDITPDQAAERLAARIEELSLENTGAFYHSNGEELPW
ncbi:SDR family oxidoreductase [Terasakiella sp. SH-1]|uniref:SDR family oxidoreductase n=1 Tax=Terasakiella sp. SH-1 TaxID=2560057 RepID=UPI0010737049|nr:SDR family oxidoreductase [Terasakiella sp. SH-1]